MTSSFKTEEDVIKDAIRNKEPSVTRDLAVTRTFLKQQCSGGDNLYDHLSSMLSKVIDERPTNVMDCFEDFSRKVRQEKNRNPNTLLAGTFVEPDSLKSAKTLLQCFIKNSNVDKGEVKSERVTDFIHIQFFWVLAGYGFPQGHLLSSSIGILENNAMIQNCRYWGRIYGLKLNYYIVETDLSEDEIKKRIDSDGGQEDSDGGRDINRKTYFVCNCLGDEWIELPKLTSNDIEMSQKIRKYFTGDLNATIRSNPQFNGNEKNLLRAVIQRITTETYAAPVGYYNVVEGNASINTNYTPLEPTKLMDLSSWSQYRMADTPLCSENSSNSIPTWSIRRKQENFPKTSMVVIRSNIWPGAVSFCSQIEQDSLYNGWGMKYSSKAFVPPLPLTTSNEYNFNAKAANDENPGTFVVKEEGTFVVKEEGSSHE